MDKFLINNQHYFVLLACLIAIAGVVISVLCYLKSAKLTKSLLVNKFKILDLNEKDVNDNSPLYTIIVSNNSMNAISIASIGFEHDGDYFNFRNECKAQLNTQNQDLVILPRGSIKLRLPKNVLENTIFNTVRSKKLKKIKVYVIGLGGESHSAKSKVIGKKMAQDFKEFYTYHKPEIIARYVSKCNSKVRIGIKLNLIEKLKLKLWAKVATIPAANKQIADKEYSEIVKEIPALSTDTGNVVNSVELDNPKPEAVNEVFESQANAIAEENCEENSILEELDSEQKSSDGNDEESDKVVLEKEKHLSENN